MSNEKEISSDFDLEKELNLPERDENTYPLPNKDQMLLAGDFMFKLNMLASSVDKNLQSLVWGLYLTLREYILKTEGDDQEQAINLASVLDDLKSYLKEAKNPIFENMKSKDN